MAFCRNCGKELQDDVRFCPNCGTPVDAQPKAEQVPPEQVKVASPADDIEANKCIAWLSYLGILFLIPMLVRKESKYCQFHVRQGVTVFATQIAYAIATNILLLIIGLIFPGGSFLGFHYISVVYTFFSVILSLGYVVFFVCWIIGIINAATGKQKKLPIFGSITLLEPLMDKFYGVR